METISHPVTLERYFFTRSVVVTVDSHRPGEGVLSIGPENKIDLAALEDNPGHYQVTMRSTFNSNGDPSAPYTIDMQCVGLFVADSSLSPEDAPRVVTNTAHNVLYGAIREAIAWITGRQPFGTLVLGLSVLQPRSDSTVPQLNE